MLFLTLVLGIVLFLYGSRLGDQWGGLLCLCAYATMPVMLAFGPLVLTDIAITLFVLLTLWAFASMWRSPSRGTILRFGLAFGGALLSKFSAGLLFFCFRCIHSQPPLASGAGTAGRQGGASGMASFAPGGVSPRALFCLRWSFMPSTLSSRGMSQPTRWLSWTQHGGPAPAQIAHATLDLPAWPGVVRLYREAAFFHSGALVPAWRMVLLSGLVPAQVPISLSPFARSRADRWPGCKVRPVRLAVIPEGLELHWRAVWVFLVVFSGACMLSRFQFSIRHFSVPLALLVLLLAPLPRSAGSLRRSGWPAARAGVWLTVALALASVATAVRAYPYYLPFLNSLSGGRPGYDLVSDSNLDWNQGLPMWRISFGNAALTTRLDR
jgi:hypothetical protein